MQEYSIKVDGEHLEIHYAMRSSVHFFIARSSKRSKSFDIVGLKLGMQFEEAKVKIGPGFRYQTSAYADPDMKLYSAFRTGPNSALDLFLLETVRNKLVLIEYSRSFASDSLPNIEITKQSVLQKFGQPTETDGSHYLCISDRSGQRLSQSPARSPLSQCQIIPGRGAEYDVQAPGHPAVILWYPNGFSPVCGVTGSVSIGASRQLVTGVGEYLVDYGTLFEEAQKRTAKGKSRSKNG